MYFYGGYFYSNVSGKEDKRHIANYEIGLNDFIVNLAKIEIGINYSKEDKRHIANYEIGLNDFIVNLAKIEIGINYSNEKYNTYFINGSFPIKRLNTNLNIEIGIGYSLNKLIDINVGLRYLFNGVMSYEIGEIEDKIIRFIVNLGKPDVLFIYPFNYYYYRKISMGKVNWEERKKESDELWKENKISEVNWQEE